MHLQIEQLQKLYSQQVVLDIPQLEVSPGELVGIVGNNGAGKTTLLRLLLDLIMADSGWVTINGQKVSEDTSWKQVTGSFLDEGFLIGFLTPEEYLAFNGSTYGMTTEEVEQKLKEYERFSGGEVLGTGKYIRQLSAGNKQKTGIMGAMLSGPELLILDEPFNFLDPSSQIIIRSLLADTNRTLGTTMIVSSHNISHLSGICTRIILLEKGRIIKDIRPSEAGQMQEVEEYFDLRSKS
jgi:ABC-2 type transport system ATP-binding protein